MSGAGTELGKLIPDWLAKQSRGCGCNNWKRKMDDNGIEWCKANKLVIVQRLVQQKNMLPTPLKMLPRSALTAGAAVLVDKAIANAESQVSGQIDNQ